MLDRHSPDPAFLDRVEARVLAEARRQRQAPAPARGWAASKLKLAVAAATIAIVSMGLGAAGVAAAYQVQSNEQRNLLTADLQRRLDLARQRIQVASQELDRAAQQFAIGVVSGGAVLDAKQKVVESQAEMESMQSRLSEVRITGRDAVDDLTAPRIDARDFVGDRIRIGMTAARAALDTEQARLRDVEKQRSLGLIDEVPVQMAQSRVAQAQATLTTLESRLQIRQQFLAGSVSAPHASLQALEADALQRRAALAPKLQIAEQHLQRAQTLFTQGLTGSVDVAQARLDVEQVQTDLAKADLDLALVRRQLQSAKGGGS